MSWRSNLRKGRSHLITVAILLIASTIIVKIEDSALQREAGKRPPEHRLDAVGSWPDAKRTAPPCSSVVDGQQQCRKARPARSASKVSDG